MVVEGDVELRGIAIARFGGFGRRGKMVEGVRSYPFGQGGPGPGKWLR
jgi:hypothetical protein